MTNRDRFSGLTDAQLLEIHRACEAFEQALSAQESAPIEDWLNRATEEIRDSLFRELLAIELELAPPRDEQQAAAYKTRFPDRGDDIDQVLQEVSMTWSAEEPSSESPPKTPQLFDRNSEGRFRLESELARGGMGVVLKGHDLELGRELAIKVLLDTHKDKPEVIQRFVEEARIGGQLQHPGIAPIYELGQFEDKRPFFAMKLVEGETLAKHLADRKDLADGRAKFIGIFEQVCQTMAYAHSRGVIHRDLKPANVMVGAFGEVQVMDWGLAKVLPSGVATEKALSVGESHGRVQSLRSHRGKADEGAPESETQVGSVMGTPAYMPPEQALGEIDHLDERADVFGLGAILCEMLTGKPPYVANGRTSAFRLACRGKLDDCLERLRSCGADDDLIALTEHCLKPKREDRLRDAGVLAERVTAYLESVESKLRATEVERAAEAVRADAEAAHAASESRRLKNEQLSASKLRRMVAGLAVVTLFAGGALAAALVANRKANDLAEVASTEASAARFFASEADAQTQSARQHAAKAEAESVLAREAKRQAEAATERAQEQLVRSQWLVYASRIMLANNDFESGTGELSLHRLEECQEDLRGWEYRYLSTRINSKQVLKGHLGNVAIVAYSFDGKSILTGGWDGTAKVWDSASGQEVTTVDGSGSPVMDAAFSPDGKHFVTGDAKKKVTIWDARRGHRVLRLPDHSHSVRSVAYSPDGDQIAVGGGDPYQPNDVKLYDATTGAVALTLHVAKDRVIDLAFSHDGNQIVTAFGKRAQVWDRETGARGVSMEHPGIFGVVWCVSCSPDGKYLVTGAEDGLVRVWDMKTGEQLHVLVGHSAGVADVSFSPDGTRIVTASWDNTIKIWDFETRKELHTLKGHPGWVMNVAYSPDGKRVVSGGHDRAARVWDAVHGQSVMELKHGPVGAIRSVAFSPDNHRVVTGGTEWSDCAVKVWEVESGETLFTLDGHSQVVQSIAFSPDGKRIVTGSVDNTVRIWDGSDGQQLHVLPGYTTPVAFSADGSRIACGHEDSPLRLLDAETYEVIRIFEEDAEHQPVCVAFSPDATLVVTVGFGNEQKVWDVDTGQAVLGLAGHDGWVRSVAFSPSGKHILTGGSDSTARVWDASSGEAVLVLEGHTGPVNGVAFSPDGSRIVTASDDKSAKLWEVERGIEVLSLNGHGTEVMCVAFSPDGNRIVTGTANPDNTARLWHAEEGPRSNHWPLPVLSTE